MEEYTILRQFADSWMLLVLFAFFIGVVLWVFRHGLFSRQFAAPTPS